MTIKINHLKFYPNVASLSYDPRSTVKAVHKMFQIVEKKKFKITEKVAQKLF